jgi:hypothetical protein
MGKQSNLDVTSIHLWAYYLLVQETKLLGTLGTLGIRGSVGSLGLSLGARVPGFQWEHAEHIAGIETLCPAFAQQEHSVHIWNVIWTCAPNVPISNI